MLSTTGTSAADLAFPAKRIVTPASAIDASPSEMTATRMLAYMRYGRVRLCRSDQNAQQRGRDDHGDQRTQANQQILSDPRQQIGSRRRGEGAEDLQPEDPAGVQSDRAPERARFLRHETEDQPDEKQRHKSAEQEPWIRELPEHLGQKLKAREPMDGTKFGGELRGVGGWLEKMNDGVKRGDED